jgi:circadian clock protein KaiC
VSVLKVRDSRIDDRLRLFEISDGGIVVDETPDRAEDVLIEIAGGAAQGPSWISTSGEDTRLQGR